MSGKTLATNRSSIKRRKAEDDVSPDTLRAQALSKSVDICAHCNKHCSGKNSEAIQCDLCYSWVHIACEGISKSHSKSLKEVLSVNNENIIYLCKSNQCNVRFKQLLACKISPSEQFETVDLSSKVDDLATQSAKLEKELAEAIAFIKNASRSTEKSVNSKQPAVSAQPLASNMNSPIDRRFNVVCMELKNVL